MPPHSADPAHAPARVERVHALVHELRGLLDGSSRCLGLALQSIASVGSASEELRSAHGQLETVQSALDRMGDLVHAAMIGPDASIGSALATQGRAVTVCEALRHAAEVLRPLAAEHRQEIRVRLEPGLEAIPAGPLYAVFLNGLRNAVESSASTKSPGQVTVSARLLDDPARPSLLIEIEDQGAGLPSGLPPSRLFEPGVTTKPRGSGLGLALARQIVVDLGGTVDLLDGFGPEARPGAIFRVWCPLPHPEPRSALGRGG
ncbi:MAG: HAMP domain-containing histidine kinase [Phycisphaerales bacterium]|nr:HAMP domain-containing histidine kinase [Phycisphaerales bacterium]